MRGFYAQHSLRKMEAIIEVHGMRPFNLPLLPCALASVAAHASTCHERVQVAYRAREVPPRSLCAPRLRDGCSC